MIESINDVPLLIRREIEARILAPFVEDLTTHLSREAVVATLRATIARIAREQGAAACGGNDLAAFTRVTDKWQQGGALALTVLRQDRERYEFDVTRCRFAEMYRRLGIPELGDVLSCNRDFEASEGFNPRLRLTRTRTIMGGAVQCDFRYRLGDGPEDRESPGTPPPS